MLNFTKIKDNISIVNLRSLGFEQNDDVMVLFDDGFVLYGKLNFIEDYETLFDVQLVLDWVCWKTRDMSCAVGIAKVGFTC